ncbi:hypothetical protein A3K63_02465 [Candidatus Micrarchaeota archaeon RBG_16_49_10]|nr:MAG: hypothetical protein A3K63_02465 [Candidatus Micrarchaeota archaeon RBG_16_49_10]
MWGNMEIGGFMFDIETKQKIMTTPTNHWEQLPEVAGKGKPLTPGRQLYSAYEQFPHLPGTADSVLTVLSAKKPEKIFEDSLEELSGQPEIGVHVQNIVQGVSNFRMDLATKPESVLGFTEYAWDSFKRFIETDRSLLQGILSCQSIGNPEKKAGSLFAYLMKSFWDSDRLSYWLTPLEEAKVPKPGFLGGFDPYGELKATLTGHLERNGVQENDMNTVIEVGHEPSIFVTLGSCQPEQIKQLAYGLAQKTGATQEGWETLLGEKSKTSAKGLYDFWKSRNGEWKLLVQFLGPTVAVLSQSLKNLKNLDHMIFTIESVPQMTKQDGSPLYCWGSTSLIGPMLLEHLSAHPYLVGGGGNIAKFYGQLETQQIPENYTSLVGRQAMGHFYPLLSGSAKGYCLSVLKRFGW